MYETERSPQEKDDWLMLRLILVVSGIPMVPVSLAFTYYVTFEIPMPRDFLGFVTRLIADEIALGLTLFFILGLYWGISGSIAMEKLLDKTVVQLVCIVIPVLAIAGAAVVIGLKI